MICPKCGCQLNEDAQFCIACGAKISGGQPRRKDNSNALVAVVIIVALLILAGLGAAYYFLFVKSGQAGDAPSPTQGIVSGITEYEGTQGSSDESTPADPTDSLKEDDEEIFVQENANAGIPKLDYSYEVLRKTYDLYWDEINRDQNAQSYSLLNMFGDEIPELIIKSKDTKGVACYNLYFIFDGSLLVAKNGPVTAGVEDRLYGNNGTFIAVHNDDIGTSATIDMSLSVTSETLILEGEPEYTDNVLSCNAAEDGLLNLVLFGSDKKVKYSGWIRHKGLDYRYYSGKCASNRWIQEDEVMYYVGNDGYVLHTTTEEQIQTLMDEYWQSFIDACHGKDTALLKHATDRNRKDMKYKLADEWNRDRTFSDFDCQIYVMKTDNYSGTILLNMNVLWSFSDDAKGTGNDSVRGYYDIVLVCQDGQWLIDEVEYA